MKNDKKYNQQIAAHIGCSPIKQFIVKILKEKENIMYKCKWHEKGTI